MEPPWDDRMKMCSNVPGHKNKMASRPIYGKNLQTSFETKRPITFKYYQMCSNDDTGLTLNIFMTWSNLFPNASARVKAYTAYSHVFPSLA